MTNSNISDEVLKKLFKKWVNDEDANIEDYFKEAYNLSQKQSEKKHKWYFNEINRLREQLSQQQTAFDNFIKELKDKILKVKKDIEKTKLSRKYMCPRCNKIFNSIKESENHFNQTKHSGDYNWNNMNNREKEEKLIELQATLFVLSQNEKELSQKYKIGGKK